MVIQKFRFWNVDSLFLCVYVRLNVLTNLRAKSKFYYEDKTSHL